MRYEYQVTSPMLSAAATSPIMDFTDMEDWLNHMDAQGWEFVSHGQTTWLDRTPTQNWWIFRRPRK